MSKPRKITTYWVKTKKYCGSIAVDQNGIIYARETAPCYRWMSGKKFSKMLNYLRYKRYLQKYKKLDEDVASI
jgi:hypothetical protein